MSHYFDKATFASGHFRLEVHPYAAAPENPFEPSAALQYGADFKMEFKRTGTFRQDIGLIQLIFPQTAVFRHTRRLDWNVDRQAFQAQPVLLAAALYGLDDVKIGSHSLHYAGEPMRTIAPDQCSVIDTPREFNNSFERGVFGGSTNTKFANYVLELGSGSGRIYDQGAAWGYYFTQDADDPNSFRANLLDLKASYLSKNSEHVRAIAAFLNLDVETVKESIAG